MWTNISFSKLVCDWFGCIPCVSFLSHTPKLLLFAKEQSGCWQHRLQTFKGKYYQQRWVLPSTVSVFLYPNSNSCSCLLEDENTMPIAQPKQMLSCFSHLYYCSWQFTSWLSYWIMHLPLLLFTFLLFISTVTTKGNKEWRKSTKSVSIVLLEMSWSLWVIKI